MSMVKFWWNGLLFLLSGILFLIGQYWIPMVMVFAGGVFGVSIVFLLYHFITANLLGDVNDKKEIIENKNMAYAIYQVGIMLLIVIPFLAAFLVFFTLKDIPSAH